jgi:membrane-bound serine protease (ClpP class)
VKTYSIRLPLVSKRWGVAFAFVVLFIGCFGLNNATAQLQQNAPLVLELQINGDIEPVLATYVEEGLADAARRQAALVLITMDTPGGLSDSTQKIVQHILDSPVPVAVYVAP